MTLRKTTRDIVGGSVMLGVGGVALGGMSSLMPPGTGSSLISNTIGKGGKMMGAVVPAAMGMGVLGMLNPKKKRRR